MFLQIIKKGIELPKAGQNVSHLKFSRTTGRILQKMEPSRVKTRRMITLLLLKKNDNCQNVSNTDEKVVNIKIYLKL